MIKEIKVVVSTDSTVESIMEVASEDWDDLTEDQKADWAFQHAD